MAYVIIEKSFAESDLRLCSGHGVDLDCLEDLLVGFFLPDGRFYVDIDVSEDCYAHEIVSYRNGGEK